MTTVPTTTPGARRLNVVFWCAVAVSTMLFGFIVGLMLGERFFLQPSSAAVNTARAERLRQEREAASKDCRQPIAVNSPEIDGRCAVTIRSEATTSKVIYEDMEERFSLDVPFSLFWGTDRYRLETVEHRDDAYYFGRPIDDSCHWSREFYMEVSKTSDPERFIDGVRLSSETVVSPEEFMAGSLKAYRLTVTGLCDRPQVIIFGARRAYRFGYAVSCAHMPKSDEAMARLIDVASGLHLAP